MPKTTDNSPAADTPRQEALQAISRLPETADMDEIMYRLYVLDKIRRGQKSAQEERLISAADLKREIEQW